MTEPKLILFIAIITIASGFADAWAFIHASQAWERGQIVWQHVGRSALWFATANVLFWWNVKYLQEIGAGAPELQTVLWFGVTIVGVALISGKFLDWSAVDQVVALSVLLGVVWLTIRVPN